MDRNRGFDKWTGSRDPRLEVLDRVRAVHVTTGHALDGTMPLALALDAITELAQSLELWKWAA